MQKELVFDYSFQDYGVDGEQYFPGVGTHGTDYDSVSVGIGDNPREAAEDALEMLCQGEHEIPADVMAEMERDIEALPEDSAIPEGAEETHHYFALFVKVSPAAPDTILERFGKRQKGNFVTIEDEETEENASVSYGDLDAIPPGRALSLACSAGQSLWFEVPYCGGSDYSGGTVERSNFRSFKTEHGATEGVYWLPVYGGHDTFAIVVRADCRDAGILETIESLEDYPLIDESDHSELESELENEAWLDFGRDEFAKDLATIHGFDRFTFGQDFPAPIDVDNGQKILPGIARAELEPKLPPRAESEEDGLAFLWRMANDRGPGDCTIHEEGGSVYFRTEDLANKIKPEEVRAVLGWRKEDV